MQLTPARSDVGGLFYKVTMKTICISQQDDGTFSVYEEKPEGEAMGEHQMPDGSMMEGDSHGAQQAASLDEALEAARGMLSADARTPEEQVMAGYGKSKMPAKPSPQQVFGG